MFDRGSGSPIVVVPGVQGRWEWMTPALEVLSERFRVLSYSLCGDPGAEAPADPELGFESYVRQLERVLDRAGLARSTVCGVSYGGLIALRYAARHPSRVGALVLVSTPAPGWQPSHRQRAYLSRPWLAAPVFAVTSPLRMWPEIRAALPDWRERMRFAVRHGRRVLAAPMNPGRVAARVRQEQEIDFHPDCAQVRVPTLVVTGDDSLDTVVPVGGTLEYCSLISGAQYARLDRTGHIGMMTQPRRFVGVVETFLHAADR